MTKRRFDPMALRSDVKKGKKSDYDDATARRTGIKVKKGEHGFSLDPKTGMVLKGRGHKTFWKTQAGEEMQGEHGADVKYKKGRYYAVPRKGPYRDRLKGTNPPSKGKK